jgi:hypothetical protein
MPQTPVTYDNVEIVRQSGTGNWVRIGGRAVFVGESVGLPGTTIHRPGDRGRLVLPHWFAEAWGLPAGSA